MFKLIEITIELPSLFPGLPLEQPLADPATLARRRPWKASNLSAGHERFLSVDVDENSL